MYIVSTDMDVASLLFLTGGGEGEEEEVEEVEGGGW